MKIKTSSNGHHIHYIAQGTGPSIILTHGVGGSLHQWSQLIPDLVDSGFKVYAPDLLGHGDSAKPKSNGKGYSIESIYSHFSTWIGELRLNQSFAMIGHSMGAYLSILHAIRNPGLVSHLVLVNPYFSPKQLSLHIRLTLMQPHVSVKILDHTPHWTISKLIALQMNGDNRLSKEQCDKLALDIKRADPKVITFPTTTHDLTSTLHQVKPLTLVVWGDKDATLSPDQYPKLVNALPNGISLSFPDGGHNLHLTHTHKFNKVVTDFLNGSGS